MQNLTALRAEAVRVGAHDHEPAELATLLKDAGGTLETFLKTHVFAGSNDGLNGLINHLPTLGVSGADVAALHVLRQRYNAAKHDAGYSPSVEDVTTAVDGARAVVGSWSGQGYGSCDSPATPAYRRCVRVVGWDHFTSGDGEVQVFAPVDPDECDFPLGIDMIYVKGLAFPALLGPLGSAVQPAAGIIPDKFIDAWENTGDCSGAFVFDGAYRELLRALCGAELRLDDLLPDLKRENDASAMRTAVAFAAIDVIREPDAPTVPAELTEAILLRALAEYAAPRTASFTQTFASSLADLLLEIPQADRAATSGPRFVHASKFRQLRPTAIASRASTCVGPGPELVLLLDNL